MITPLRRKVIELVVHINTRKRGGIRTSRCRLVKVFPYRAEAPLLIVIVRYRLCCNTFHQVSHYLVKLRGIL